MVKGDTILIILVLLIDARCTTQSFLHDRFGTRDGTARKVGITTNRREMSRSRTEIVIRDRRKSTRTMSGTVHLAVIVSRVRARLEGRRVGDGTAHAWDVAVLAAIRLPVNGLHAVFEVGRRLELPLADDRPDDNGSTDAHGDDNEDCHSSVRKC